MAERKGLRIHKSAVSLIDSRKFTEGNDGLVIKKKRNFSLDTFFKTDQTKAIAYFTSDLIAKGFNNEQIRQTIKEKYDVDMSESQLKVLKTLLRKMWRAQMAADMNEQIVEEVNAINVQIKECWAAWERSKKGNVSKTSRTENSTSESDEMTYDLTEIVTKEDTCAGEVKYMTLINDLGKEKRKILGLYAPDKKEGSQSGNGNTAIQINVVGSDGQSASATLGNILAGNVGQGEQTEPDNASVEDAEAEVMTAEEQLKELPRKTDEPDIDAFFEELMNE